MEERPEPHVLECIVQRFRGDRTSSHFVWSLRLMLMSLHYKQGTVILHSPTFFPFLFRSQVSLRHAAPQTRKHTRTLPMSGERKMDGGFQPRALYIQEPSCQLSNGPSRSMCMQEVDWRDVSLEREWYSKRQKNSSHVSTSFRNMVGVQQRVHAETSALVEHDPLLLICDYEERNHDVVMASRQFSGVCCLVLLALRILRPAGQILSLCFELSLKASASASAKNCTFRSSTEQCSKNIQAVTFQDQCFARPIASLPAYMEVGGFFLLSCGHRPHPRPLLPLNITLPFSMVTLVGVPSRLDGEPKNMCLSTSMTYSRTASVFGRVYSARLVFLNG